MISISHSVPALSINEDDNPLVGANKINNDKTITLLKEVDTLLATSGRIKIKTKDQLKLIGVKK